MSERTLGRGLSIEDAHSSELVSILFAATTTLPRAALAGAFPLTPDIASKVGSVMPQSKRFFNRELAWLEFNQRVLDEACDPNVPLVERVKFLAITASNLDEFFRVRVGELARMTADGIVSKDPSGRTPAQQLADVRERASLMIAESDECYETLERELAVEGWPKLSIASLNADQRDRIDYVFESEIESVLSPLAVDPRMGELASSAASRLPGEVVSLAVQLQSNELFGGETRFALIPLARPVSRFFFESEGYLLLEDIVEAYVHRFFVGQTVAAVTAFRITRDADITLDDDEASDLVSEMEDVLDARKKGRVVRLEVATGSGHEIVAMLQDLYSVSEEELVYSEAPLGLSAWFGAVPRERLPEHRDPPWRPQEPAWLNDESLFSIIARKDRLLIHPYESFEPVIRFLEEAADDPDVVAVKQTLYRTAKDSRIVNALIRAAQNGKHVTVLVELKARFDEARNIDRARELEEAGVFVTYGVRGLKTHAKLCLVARREPHGMTRYVHVGTGNYNESTAKLYGDASLFTCDPDIGHDAVAVFNAITGFSEPHSLRKLRWAPINLRDRLIELIDAESERARQGLPAWIQIKLNSLVDPEVIESLYTASQAGVRVEINVRGICCLRPGVAELSENIRVIRLVDRYLEHARVFVFANGGDPIVTISSADWMPRNLDRRIELLIPVESADAKRALMDLLDRCLKDNTKATEILADGSQRRIVAPSGRQPRRAQELLWHEKVREAETADDVARTSFVPHEPADDN